MVLFASVQASAIPHHGCGSTAGIIEAVAKDFFDTDVAMSILDMNEEVERTGKKEHVVFLVVQKARRQIRGAKADWPQDSEDIQADQEVLSVLCLQRAQFPNSRIVEFKAGFPRPGFIDSKDQVILGCDGLHFVRSCITAQTSLYPR